MMRHFRVFQTGNRGELNAVQDFSACYRQHMRAVTEQSRNLYSIVVEASQSPEFTRKQIRNLLSSEPSLPST